jgi:hypothetical protein
MLPVVANPQAVKLEIDPTSNQLILSLPTVVLLGLKYNS